MPLRQQGLAEDCVAAQPRLIVRYETVDGGWARLLGSPFLGARWGSVDERVLPTTAPSRLAAELKQRKTIRQTVVDRGLIGDKLFEDELDRLDALAMAKVAV